MTVSELFPKDKVPFSIKATFSIDNPGKLYQSHPQSIFEGAMVMKQNFEK